MTILECPSRVTLDAYRAGSLSASERGMVEVHLAACPRCRQYLGFAGERGRLGSDVPTESFSAGGPVSAAEGSGVQPGGSQLEATVTREGSLGRIRDYQLLEVLGHGGMGVVYKAMHMQLERLVALKVVKPGRRQDSKMLARFQREMKAVGKLGHQNVVAAHDAGEWEGQLYLVMEYVEGINLSKLVERLGCLGIPDACELTRQAAVALEHIEKHGLIHRDIKPSNLLLSVEGYVKLLDLGLALLQTAGEGDEAGEELTQDGHMMGTIDYMAPEQMSDSHRVDIRADIYSLGATLYKLLSGHAPYGGLGLKLPAQKIKALCGRPIPPISGRRPEISKELADVVHRMLRRDPDERYTSPAEVIYALGRFTAGAQVASLAARGLGRPWSEVPERERSRPTDGHAEAAGRETDAGARQVAPRPARRPDVPGTPGPPCPEGRLPSSPELASAFRITVQRPLNDRYPLLVQAASIVGDPSGTLGLDRQAAAALATRISLESGDTGWFADTGRQLFEALFVETLGSTYAVNRHTTAPEGQDVALRLMLHVLDDELRRLPWELAYDHVRKEWLATGRATPLSRYLDACAVSLPAVTLPLRLLVCVAEPNDGRYLDAISQVMRLEASLRHLKAQDLLAVSVLQHAQLDSLRAELEQCGPHIVHFIGHGYASQGRVGVFLERADGSGDRLSIEVLRQLLGHSKTVGLVVLDADASDEVAHGLAQAGIPCIGMRKRLEIEASHHLCQALYGGLALGRPLDATVNESRFRIQLECGEHRRDWWLPVTYLPRGSARVLSLAVAPAPATPPATLAATPPRTVPVVEEIVDAELATPAAPRPAGSTDAAPRSGSTEGLRAGPKRSSVSRRRPPPPYRRGRVPLSPRSWRWSKPSSSAPRPSCCCSPLP